MGVTRMNKQKILDDIEELREKMVEYYLKDDLDNAHRISRILDHKIYIYISATKK